MPEELKLRLAARSGNLNARQAVVVNLNPQIDFQLRIGQCAGQNGFEGQRRDITGEVAQLHAFHILDPRHLRI